MVNNDPLIGKRLGDYTIESLLGTGGMARVYRGYDDKLDRYAAIKIIEPQIIADEAEEEEYRERFLREARSIARLNHPNIVGVYQFNQFEDRYYIAMAYIEGENLRDVLKDAVAKDGLISQAKLLDVLKDIGAALDYAHQQGIIHRDVKPSNIIVTRDGRSVLTDFGLALNAVEGTIGNTFGSVHYIAPEQAISSAQAVAQSDQYSLGIIAYEMLTGQVPFDDASAMSVALKHISDPPPPLRDINPDILSEVEEVVMRALDKDFTKRYDTCQLFVEALKNALHVVDDVPTKDIAPTPRLSAASTEAVHDDMPTLRDTASRPSEELIQKALQDKGINTSQPAAPVKPASQQGGAKTGLIVAGVVVVALLIGVAVLLFGAGGNDETPTATPIAAAQTTDETATEPATATSTEALTPTDDATLTAESADVSQTEQAGLMLTNEAATQLAIPTETPTPIPPSDTPEPTATNTVEPTATDTPVPTVTPTPGFEMVDETDAQILLRYDGRTFVLFNRDENNSVGVRRLRFVQFVPNEDGEFTQGRTYVATDWDTTALNDLPALRCLQLFRNSINSLPEGEPPSDMCESRLRFRSTVNEFWFNQNPDAYFEVRMGEVDVLATCPVARPGSFTEQRCIVRLP